MRKADVQQKSQVRLTSMLQNMHQGHRKADTVLHFSYGANCNPAVLKRRDVTPLTSVPAVANRGVCLVFQHRGGFATLMRTDRTGTNSTTTGQRAFATAGNSTADVCIASPQVQATILRPHGMLYEVSQRQLDTLCAFETGYTLESVEVTAYGAQQQTTATAFVTRPALLLPRAVAPTEKYLNLIVEGAQKGGIEQLYVKQMAALDTAPHGGLPPEYFDTPSGGLAATAIAVVLCLMTAAVLGF